jgi:hypothetical protein
MTLPDTSSSYFQSNSVGLPLATSAWYDDHVSSTLQTSIIAAAVGTATFATTLSLSTFLQLKLRMSTGTLAPIPSLIGIATVGTASLMSHIASMKSYQMSTHNWKKSFDTEKILSFPPLHFNLSNRRDMEHVFRVCLVGIIVYKGLGGRFWSISPSSLTTLGSFARTFHSLPATVKYASPSERIKIEQIGRKVGCHTCGSRKIFSRGKNGIKFIADHMPPQAVVKQMNAAWHRRLLGFNVKQRFYPQCIDCSGKQGGILSKASQDLLKTKSGSLLERMKPTVNLSSAGGGINAHFHGFRGYNLRLEHLTGGVIAAITVHNTDERNILHRRGGNRKRFLEFQTELEKNTKLFANYIKARIRWIQQ